MQTGGDRFTSLGDYLEHLRFYVKKYGLMGAAQVAWSRLWARTVGETELLYSMDLQDGEIGGSQAEEDIRLLAFKSQGELGAGTVASLCNHKSRRSCSKFLENWFSRGATLWLSLLGEEVVGLQWTIAGGFDGFYSIPVQPCEVIIVAVEVFTPYRGRSLYPLMLSKLLRELKRSGFSRAYLKVAASNAPMQRSMAKVACQKMGRVYTRQTRRRLITVWDRKAAADKDAM